ncbi:hypothetical protein GEMRC1_004389 [Eukaryota sp. GEM-RC1]
MTSPNPKVFLRYKSFSLTKTKLYFALFCSVSLGLIFLYYSLDTRTVPLIPSSTLNISNFRSFSHEVAISGGIGSAHICDKRTAFDDTVNQTISLNLRDSNKLLYNFNLNAGSNLNLDFKSPSLPVGLNIDVFRGHNIVFRRTSVSHQCNDGHCHAFARETDVYWIRLSLDGSQSFNTDLDCHFQLKTHNVNHCINTCTTLNSCHLTNLQGQDVILKGETEEETVQHLSILVDGEGDGTILLVFGIILIVVALIAVIFVFLLKPTNITIGTENTGRKPTAGARPIRSYDLELEIRG